MLRFTGLADRAAHFMQENQLFDVSLWKKFVDVFRSQPDAVNQGWRGEYWGKMMRGGALVYGYTRDSELYRILTDSVCDMMTAAEADGRVSSYARDAEFDSWDIWCRKYVMLGCEYYLEICTDEALKTQIVMFISRCADYIITQIGPGKKAITDASRSWFGINSSSVLEPIVRLYKLTGEKRYLDFAAYIVEHGGAKDIDIFELAYENRLYPYQYGVSKAYELTSCFEGLLEYYSVTKLEKYKTAVINYANAVLDSEISIIGSCGITHELFDHTRTRQTVQHDDVMQETCVTVTWMKFCARMLALTGDSKFADAMEHSFYNAYLGALNVHHRECNAPYRAFPDAGVVSTGLPFDSSSPLPPGKRGQKVGGLQLLPDRSYYGCCACIGSAGVGVFLGSAVTTDDEGITVNFFESGEAELCINGTKVLLIMETAYPTDGTVKLTVKADTPTAFTLNVRNPGWAEGPAGYRRYTKVWHRDTVELRFEMPLRFHYPESWIEDVVYTDMSKSAAGYHSAAPVTVYHEEKDDHFIAVTKGPLTLAADERTGKSLDSTFAPQADFTVCKPQIEDGEPCLLNLRFSPDGEEPFTLVDYASAGLDWETRIAAWLPTK